MQRNPHSYQIATGYRTFYSLSLIYQPITKKRLFFLKSHTQFTKKWIPMRIFHTSSNGLITIENKDLISLSYLL